MGNSGRQDGVRETVMREVRASIRDRQRRGASAEMIHAWIDRRKAEGEITEREAAVARLITHRYTEPIWEGVYPVPARA
jgi:hypothetical protein